jgi:anti-sigma-K factor RskA
MSDDPNDRDMVAGIYVLGALEPDEARAVEALAEHDHGMAASIDLWRSRLAPMADAVRPAPPPPDLLPRIEATLGFAANPIPAPTRRLPSALARAWHNIAVWRIAAAAAALLALILAAVALNGRSASPQFAAALAPPNAQTPAFLASLEPGGSLLLRPLSRIPLQPGKDMQLWALAEGAKTPVSLGPLPAIGRRVAAHDLEHGGTQLLVSLEPAGGSPTGLPTGPILYTGMLTRLD